MDRLEWPSGPVSHAWDLQGGLWEAAWKPKEESLARFFFLRKPQFFT